jgi:uncharacterized membrane protein (UPF0127 family)
MGFDLDVYFLDSNGRLLRFRPDVPPLRVLSCRGAVAVLEIPSKPL